MPAGRACWKAPSGSSGRSATRFRFCASAWQRFRPVRLPGLPPLVAGAIGYFSYDMVRLIERLPKRLRDEIGLYDAMLMFYHGIIAFDHVQHRLWIVRNVFTDGPRQFAREISRRGEGDSADAGNCWRSRSPRNVREGPERANRARRKSAPTSNALSIWRWSGKRSNIFARAIFSRWCSASDSPRKRKPRHLMFTANCAL